jgi:hypothetical protein
MGFVKINSSSPVGLCIVSRVLYCPILLATGFERVVFRVSKKKLRFCVKAKVPKLVGLKNKVDLDRLFLVTFAVTQNCHLWKPPLEFSLIYLSKGSS